MKTTRRLKEVSAKHTLLNMLNNKYDRTKANIASLNLTELETLRVRQEEEAEEMRKAYPPGRRYFSYILPNDEDYRMLDALPTAEQMDELKAMRLTGGMLGFMTNGRALIPVAMHHNSRVVEFEFDLVVNKVGDTELYEPFM